MDQDEYNPSTAQELELVLWTPITVLLTNKSFLLDHPHWMLSGNPKGGGALADPLLATAERLCMG